MSIDSEPAPRQPIPLNREFIPPQEDILLAAYMTGENSSQAPDFSVYENLDDMPWLESVQLFRDDRFNYLNSRRALKALQDYLRSPDNAEPLDGTDYIFEGNLSPTGYLLGKDGKEIVRPDALLEGRIPDDVKWDIQRRAFKDFVSEIRLGKDIDAIEAEMVARPTAEDSKPAEGPARVYRGHDGQPRGTGHKRAQRSKITDNQPLSEAEIKALNKKDAAWARRQLEKDPMLLDGILERDADRKHVDTEGNTVMAHHKALLIKHRKQILNGLAERQQAATSPALSVATARRSTYQPRPAAQNVTADGKNVIPVTIDTVVDPADAPTEALPETQAKNFTDRVKAVFTKVVNSPQYAYNRLILSRGDADPKTYEQQRERRTKLIRGAIGAAVVAKVALSGYMIYKGMGSGLGHTFVDALPAPHETGQGAGQSLADTMGHHASSAGHAPQPPAQEAADLQPHTESLNAGDTIWGHATAIAAHHGISDPHDPRIAGIKNQILALNNLSEEDATKLPVDYHFRVPDLSHLFGQPAHVAGHAADQAASVGGHVLAHPVVHPNVGHIPVAHHLASGHHAEPLPVEVPRREIIDAGGAVAAGLGAIAAHGALENILQEMHDNDVKTRQEDEDSDEDGLWGTKRKRRRWAPENPDGASKNSSGGGRPSPNPHPHTARRPQPRRTA